MHELLGSLLVSWFNFVHDWSYLGVFLLMALESSIVPIPSEVVMPPAAYWAAQGQMNFWGVIAAGTAGSYFGSVVSYLVAKAVGRPVVNRFGKFFLMGPDKIAMAEVWVTRYGAGGIFFSRLLPVVRHLISIPAGILRMNFARFSLATVLGAFTWCTILTWFGERVIGDRPELMTGSPEVLVAVCREKLHWFVGAVIVLAAAYALVVYMKKRQSSRTAAV